jgi:hypothetical protein
MRIDEITINIPITIDLDGDKPRVNVAGKDAADDELDQNPVMISPQQQELELKKSEQGKSSPSIDKMLDDEDEGQEETTEQDDNIDNIKALAGLAK